MSSKLLTTREVAQMLRVSQSMVYAYAEKGIIKAIYLPHTRASRATKVNRHTVRFLLEDVENFIHSLKRDGRESVGAKHGIH